MLNLVTINVNLNDVALQAIFKEATASRDGNETGGILVGRDLDVMGTIAVIEAGDPGPGAVRRRGFFRRDLHHAQRLADEAFRQHQAVWVGEWHTHVVGDDVPSALDLKTYRGFLEDPELHFEVFISIIVTPKEGGQWQNCQLSTWVIGREDAPVRVHRPLEKGGPMLFPKEGEGVIYTDGGSEFKANVVQVPKNPFAMGQGPASRTDEK